MSAVPFRRPRRPADRLLPIATRASQMQEQIGNSPYAQVWRQCAVTHKNYVVTARLADLTRWRLGQDSVQAIFTYLNAEQREFLLNNITPAEWERDMGKEPT